MASTQICERSMRLRQSNLRANNTLSNMVLQFSFPLFEQCKVTLGSTLAAVNHCTPTSSECLNSNRNSYLVLITSARHAPIKNAIAGRIHVIT